jgi:hypothetical protein
MQLTISFRETVQTRARRDVKFRQAFALGRSPKSLMRMFGPSGKSHCRKPARRHQPFAGGSRRSSKVRAVADAA